MVDLEIWQEAAADAYPRLGINAQESRAHISNLFITLTFHLRPAAAGLRRGQAILSRTRERRDAAADAGGGQELVVGCQITCR
jgi:hypothetical protein